MSLYPSAPPLGSSTLAELVITPQKSQAQILAECYLAISRDYDDLPESQQRGMITSLYQKAQPSIIPGQVASAAPSSITMFTQPLIDDLLDAFIIIHNSKKRRRGFLARVCGGRR